MSAVPTDQPFEDWKSKLSALHFSDERTVKRQYFLNMHRLVPIRDNFRPGEDVACQADVHYNLACFEQNGGYDSRVQDASFIKKTVEAFFTNRRIDSDHPQELREMIGDDLTQFCMSALKKKYRNTSFIVLSHSEFEDVRQISSQLQQHGWTFVGGPAGWGLKTLTPATPHSRAQSSPSITNMSSAVDELSDKPSDSSNFQPQADSQLSQCKEVYQYLVVSVTPGRYYVNPNRHRDGVSGGASARSR